MEGDDNWQTSHKSVLSRVTNHVNSDPSLVSCLITTSSSCILALSWVVWSSFKVGLFGDTPFPFQVYKIEAATRYQMTWQNLYGIVSSRHSVVLYYDIEVIDWLCVVFAQCVCIDPIIIRWVMVTIGFIYVLASHLLWGVSWLFHCYLHIQQQRRGPLDYSQFPPYTQI